MLKTKKSLLAMVFCLLTILGSVILSPLALAAVSDGGPVIAPITDAFITQAAQDHCTPDLTTAVADKAGARFASFFKHPVTACRTGFIAGFKQVPSKADACGSEAISPGNNGNGDKKICEAAYDFGVSVGPQLRDTATAAQIQAFADAACQNVQGNRFANTTQAQLECRGGFKAGFIGDQTITQKCGDAAVQANNGQFCAFGFKAGAAKGSSVDPSQLVNPDNANPADGATDPGNPDSLELDCNAGFNPLNWLVCAAIKGMVSVLGGVDNVINSLLSIGTPDETKSGDPTNIFKTCLGVNGSDPCATGNAYHLAWISFRNIALGLLVVAGLIIVMAQALGMEILDAYTVRKVLPRLLIVAVAISISWPGLRFIVELFNDLGFGVRALIQQPFANSFDSNTIHLGGGQGTAVAIATPLAFAALGIFGLFTFVGAGLLAAFIAFLVLVIRQIVVIVLVILSPIALVLYILPNTQKYWNLWMNSLGGALLMFPIISAIIAAGRVFAAVANNGGGGDTLGSFIAFAAYFAPYFLIPATFKFAGGALRTIGGFANDRGRGGFDRLKKARQESTAKHIKAARAGQRWRHNFGEFGKEDEHGNRKSIGKILSRGAELGLDVDEQVPYALGKHNVPGFKGYKAKVDNYLGGEGAAQTQKVAQEMEAKAGLNKQGYRALLGSYRNLSQDTRRNLAAKGFIKNYQEDENGKMIGGEMIAPKSRAQYKEVADAMRQSSNQDDRIGALGVDNVYGMLPTLNTDPETMRANVQGAALIGLAARGYAEDDDIELAGNRIASEKGMDYAQRIIGIAEKTGQQYHPEAKFGHSQIIVDTPDGQRFASSKHDLERSKATVASMKSQDFGQLKGDALRARKEVIIDLATETRYDPETKQNILTDRARGMQKIIVSQASTHGNAEADAKAEWSGIVEGVGPGLKQQVEQYDRTYDPTKEGQQGPPPDTTPEPGGGPS